MASIPIPTIAPFWEHPGEKPRKVSTWKRQLDTLIDLTNRNLATDKKLANQDKNRLLFAYLGTEALRRFEHHPIVAQIDTASYNDFYAAISDTFEQPTLPALAFYKFRTAKQEATETATEFIARLRTLQADCEYAGFNADVDLAYCITQNCYNIDVQKKLFNTKPVELECYIAILQAEENATSCAAAIRTEHSQIGQVNMHKFNHRPERPYKPQKATPRQKSPIEGLSRRACLGCGSMKHQYQSSECPALNVHCSFCKRPGHYERCCIIKQKGQSPTAMTSSKRCSNSPKFKPARCQHISTAVVNDSSNNAKAQFSCCLMISTTSGQSAPISACVDTGSDISAITHAQWTQHFNRTPLQPAAIEMFNYDGSKITHAHGKFDATAMFNGRDAPSVCLFFRTNSHRFLASTSL